MDEDNAENIEYYGLIAIRTCYACPEQYDIYKDDKIVGYARLRHGHFYVTTGHPLGDSVYEADNINQDEYQGGIFRNDKERHYHLKKAMRILSKII